MIRSYHCLFLHSYAGTQLTRRLKGSRCSDCRPRDVRKHRDGRCVAELNLHRYQNRTVADHFSTIGYLIPIMSVLVVPVMPRARFLQNLLVTSVSSSPSSMEAISRVLKLVPAVDLPGRRHIAPRNVVCNPRPSQYHSYPAGRQRWWSRTRHTSESVQCCR